MLGRLKYWYRLIRSRPRRYRHLLQTVYRTRARTIVEIGVFDGKHARQMIETAAIFRPAEDIEYFGFDLFELLGDSELSREFSKRPPPCEVVRNGLSKTGARINLYRGYTRDTLPGFVEKAKAASRIDVAFIDGGHAVDTIAFDWGHVRRLMSSETVVIFDDYYTNVDPEVQGLGCRTLIDDLDSDVYAVQVLSPEDHFRKEWGTLRVRMVRVTLRQEH
jgi:hypothetical protein